MVRSVTDDIALKLAADMLASEKIVIMPCDTIYGILGLCPETEATITRLKERPPDKPYIRLVAEVDALQEISTVEIPRELLDILPAPLTLVVPDSRGIGVGVRVPDDGRLQEILRMVRRPLFSTSVNKSGQPALWKASDIIRVFGPEADLILDGGDLPGGIPSTILDITVKPCRILRQGGCIVPKHLLQ